MMNSVRECLRENDSPGEMGRRQDRAERTSDYSPDLTQLQPRQHGTRSDRESERSPALVRGPRVLTVIVVAGLPGQGSSWGRA